MRTGLKLKSLIADIYLINFACLDSRYFMIKSWNVENVETAQRDVSIMLSFLSHNSPPVTLSASAPTVLTPANY